MDMGQSAETGGVIYQQFKVKGNVFEIYTLEASMLLKFFCSRRGPRNFTAVAGTM
jgi:hypothetical protein